MLYDFRNGKTAKFIEKEIQMRIKRTSSFHFERAENINFNQIKVEGSYFFFNRGDEKLLMFAYLRSFQTEKYNTLPKYHICTCETRHGYSGYSYSSQMPVPIYCKDQREEIGKHHLQLCRNCIKETNKSIFALLAKDKPWYSYILDYANNKVFGNSDRKNDGYVHIWKQLSEAKRESVDWCCEKCNIQLKNKELKLFLEVHHLDKDTLNNKINNLQSLCILCHADEHIVNYSSGDNLLRVQQFIKFNAELIKKYRPDVIKKYLIKQELIPTREKELLM